MEQGSKEWLEHRKNFIGASDAPVIMRVSPWRTPYQLWQEKLGLGGEQKETRAMTYGKDMEEIARKKYVEHTGNKLLTDGKDTLIYHPEKSFLMASLDGITIDKSIALEIKNVCAEDHAIAKAGKIPDKYIPQVQHQLSCDLDIKMVHYFSYRKADDDFALVEVERDEKYIEKLTKEETKFWNSVLDLNSPPLTDRDYLDFDKDPEWLKMAEEWKRLHAQITELESKEKDFREALIAKAGNYSAKGGGVTLTKILRKGSVDYKKIPELIGVDLEKYRKSAVNTWRLA